MAYSTLCCAVCVLVVILAVPTSGNCPSLGNLSPTYKVWRAPGGIGRMVKSESSGNIYVGTVGKVYMLDDELQEQVHVVTSTDTTEPETNDFMLLDTLDGQEVVIVCGSKSSDDCQPRSSSNLTEIPNHIFTVPVDLDKAAIAITNKDKKKIFIACPHGALAGEGCKGRQGIKWNHFEYTTLNLGPGVIGIEFRPYYGAIYITQRFVKIIELDDIILFFSVQKSGKVTQSKVAKLCRHGLIFNTYTDMLLTCEDFQQLEAVSHVTTDTGETLIVGAFSEGQNTAVCVFKLRDVKLKFGENIQKCYNGSKSATDYINNEGSCSNPKNMSYLSEAYPTKNFTDPLAYLCLDLDIYNNIVGEIPLRSKPVIRFKDQTVTSVLVKWIKGTAIAFLGTTQGHVIKVEVLQGRCLFSVTVPNHQRIRGDMYLSQSNDDVLLNTNDQVILMPTTRCSKYISCSDCLTMDPQCGWSMSMFRCLPLENSDGWLSSVNGDTCPVVLQTVPPSPLNLDADTILTLYLDKKVPEMSGLTCVFTGNNLTLRVPATPTTAKVVTCKPLDKGRIFETITGNMTMDVALYLGTNIQQPFVRTEIEMFYCKSFGSCWRCTSDMWRCRWSQTENSCINEKENETMTASDKCPHTIALEETDTSVNGVPYIHHGVQTNISIKGQYFMKETTLSCRIYPYQTLYPVQFEDDMNITCNVTMRDPLPFQSSGNFSTIVEVVTGRVGNLKIVDTVTELRVILYNCSTIIDPTENCGECKSFKQYQPHLTCDWCQGRCKHSSLCDVTSGSEQCPLPTITSVYPMTAHPKAVIQLTISGYNFGHSTDLQALVNVAGRNCTVQKVLDVSKRFTSLCELGEDRLTSTGTINLTLEGQSTVSFGELFSFRVPEILSITPSIGPRSGGSFITISGKDLITGREQEAAIGNITCNNTRYVRENETIICKTGNTTISNHEPFRVEIKFDNVAVYSEMGLFYYKDDPRITDIKPRTSFRGGGRQITIYGTNLSAIQTPQMYTEHGDNNNNTIRSRAETCSHFNDSLIFCKTPPFPNPGRSGSHVIIKRSVSTAADDSHITTRMFFVMDDVRSENITEGIDNKGELYYYKNPEVKKLSKNARFREVLIIKGRRLRVATNTSDFVVLIGSGRCKITEVRNETIECRPPLYEDLQDDNLTFVGGLAKVVVNIGYLSYDAVGFVKYEIVHTDKSHGDKAVKYIVAAVVVAVLVAVFLVLGVGLFVNIRKRRVSYKEGESLMYKMDRIESTFRTQCREEFAALQTTVSDLTSDLEGGKVLFRDFGVYATKMLIPSGSEHPVFSPPGVLPDGSSKALDGFKSLLINSQFLILIIKTLEKQSTFTIYDKSNMATMLVILNDDNMEYITKILKTLLNDLIDKTIAKKSPKVLLRRSESVVEKLLTHWQSLCLYHYLQEATGSSLYILYKAIKVQVEKGPVDYITCCGKYTLSEDRLLTASDKDVNANELNLRVSHMEITLDVSVLDRDTITQVKSKMLEVIYKNVPYSQRPSVHQTGLEYVGGNGKKQILLDEDDSCERNGTWKKINTLKHYQIPDGTAVVLTKSTVEGSSENTLLLPEASSDTVIVSSLPRMKQVDRTISGASNFWHLTKQHSEEEDGVKLSSDLCLPRLLHTKATLQQYIDDFFTEMLTVGEEPPLIIKYLFDFLDTAADRHNITDPDVLHTWKCNSLLLRFWVNTIKNPEFVFDVHKPVMVDSCLSVVAQTLMDSCSTATLQLGKHSPASKLLFAKEIPRYKQMVMDFFKQIADKPAVSDKDLNSFFTHNVSQKFGGEFNQTNALLEVYKYVTHFQEQIFADLETAEESSPGVYAPFTSKLRDILDVMGTYPGN